MELEAEMSEIMNCCEFTPYMETFREYGFGNSAAGLLLKCYPIDRFLEGGKIIRDKKGNNLSCRYFQAYLGLGYTYARSGDTSHQSRKVKKTWQGSRLTRSDIYAWLLVGPCRFNQYRPQNDIQRRMKEL
jgi:hypothetical protein